MVRTIAPRHLGEFRALVVSDPAIRVHPDDAQALKEAGLVIDPTRLVPDLVLLRGKEVVAVEVVHSDGTVTEQRKAALERIAPGRTRCVSVFRRKRTPMYRRHASELAWGTEAWFADEPDRRIVL